MNKHDYKNYCVITSDMLDLTSTEVVTICQTAMQVFAPNGHTIKGVVPVSYVHDLYALDGTAPVGRPRYLLVEPTKASNRVLIVSLTSKPE
jgi:hypothetical protein